MEIDLERAKRAVAEFGMALDEARRAVRPGRAGVVRVHTEDRVIELPVTWAAAGLAAFAIAALLTSMPLGHRREEEPLGIG